MTKTTKARPIKMTAKTILAVPVSEPERVFGPDPAKLTEVYRQLVKTWHPDLNKDPQATDVLGHLANLKKVAQERALRGEWQKPGVIEFAALDGRRFELKVLRSHTFELGEIHVGSTFIAYAFTKESADLVDAAKRALSLVRYASPDMREVYEKRLPSVRASFETKDRLVVVYVKTPDQILLRDLLTFCGGKLPAKHVTWIVSELESLACLIGLPATGLVNPGIGPDTILVSPVYHAVTLIGGWPYAVKIGEKLKAAPGRVIDHVPPALLKANAATEQLTLEAIRLTACECLGHRNPITALRDSDIPSPLARWLIAPAAKTAILDFESWGKARDSSFGPRKFVELAVDPTAVYAA